MYADFKIVSGGDWVVRYFEYQRLSPMWSQLKQTKRVQTDIEKNGEKGACSREWERASEIAAENLREWYMKGSSVHVKLTNNLLRVAEHVVLQVDKFSFVEQPQTWESVQDLCEDIEDMMCNQTIQYHDHVDRQREIELCTAYLSSKQSMFIMADDVLAEALVLSSLDFIGNILQTDVIHNYLSKVLRASKIDISDRTLLRQSLSSVVPVNIWVEPEDTSLAGYQTKLFFVPKSLLLECGTTHGAITQDADTTLYFNLKEKTPTSVAKPQKDMLRKILECPCAEEHYLRCTPYGMKSSETIVLEDDAKTSERTSFKLDVPTSNTFRIDFGIIYIMAGDITFEEAIKDARMYLDTRQCESTVIQWSENTYGFTSGTNMFVVQYD